MLDQYKATVKRSLHDSHPKLYGQTALTRDLIKDFIGVDPNPGTRVRQAAPALRGVSQIILT